MSAPQPHQPKAHWQVTAFFTALLMGFSSMTAYATPDWWAKDGNEVIDADAEENNYAAANAGQLKHIVTKAAEHFNDQGIDTPAATQEMIDEWEDNLDANNYVAVNIGQVKNVSQPFWEYLVSNGITDPDGNLYTYPWTPTDATDDNNYGLANIGQLKNAFNFTAPDGVDPNDIDGDGLPDDWEQQIIDADTTDGINTIEDVIDSDDFDGDGISNLLEYQNGTDPTIHPNDLDGDELPDDWEQQIIDADTTDGINTIEDVLSGDDFDGDGLLNSWEFTYNFDPTDNDEDSNGTLDVNDDADNDGLVNGWEIIYNLDPHNGDQNNNEELDGNDDFDGDGITNSIEVNDGTDPNYPPELSFGGIDLDVYWGYSIDQIFGYSWGSGGTVEITTILNNGTWWSGEVDLPYTSPGSNADHDSRLIAPLNETSTFKVTATSSYSDSTGSGGVSLAFRPIVSNTVAYITYNTVDGEIYENAWQSWWSDWGSDSRDGPISYDLYKEFRDNRIVVDDTAEWLSPIVQITDFNEGFNKRVTTKVNENVVGDRNRGVSGKMELIVAPITTRVNDTLTPADDFLLVTPVDQENPETKFQINIPNVVAPALAGDYYFKLKSNNDEIIFSNSVVSANQPIEIKVNDSFDITESQKLYISIEIKRRPEHANQEDLYFGKEFNLLPVEIETFAKDETREIGGDRSPNWKPHKLNMDTKQNEAGHYGDFEKCVAHEWESGSGKINMAKYLRGYSQNKELYENPDILHWKVWRGTNPTPVVQESFELDVSRPQLDNMFKYQIAPVAKDSDTPLDRLIITVIPEKTAEEYDEWKSENQNLSWLADLAPVYRSITEGVSPDEGCSWSPWLIPGSYDSYYHPDADFEIRTEELRGTLFVEFPAHQACYDGDRNIILPTPDDVISPGSADRKAAITAGGSFTGHLYADVKPFIWALQIDGTPAQASATPSGFGLEFSEISEPIMHQGKELEEYSRLRPAEVPAGIIDSGCPTKTF